MKWWRRSWQLPVSAQSVTNLASLRTKYVYGHHTGMCVHFTWLVVLMFQGNMTLLRNCFTCQMNWILLTFAAKWNRFQYVLVIYIYICTHTYIYIYLCVCAPCINFYIFNLSEMPVTADSGPVQTQEQIPIRRGIGRRVDDATRFQMPYPFGEIHQRHSQILSCLTLGARSFAIHNLSLILHCGQVQFQS